MTRPLPQLTPENEFFWTSGADGKLRRFDIVKIEERRPLSKLKRWEVIQGEKKKVV